MHKLGVFFLVFVPVFLWAGILITTRKSYNRLNEADKTSALRAILVLVVMVSAGVALVWG